MIFFFYFYLNGVTIIMYSKIFEEFVNTPQICISIGYISSAFHMYEDICVPLIECIADYHAFVHDMSLQ